MPKTTGNTRSAALVNPHTEGRRNAILTANTPGQQLETRAELVAVTTPTRRLPRCDNIRERDQLG